MVTKPCLRVLGCAGFCSNLVLQHLIQLTMVLMIIKYVESGALVLGWKESIPVYFVVLQDQDWYPLVGYTSVEVATYLSMEIQLFMYIWRLNFCHCLLFWLFFF